MYKLEQIPGKFSRAQKPVITQVDRIKKYHPADPVVTPPRHFKGNLTFDEIALEHIKFDQKKDLKLPADKDARLDQETEVEAQAPWLPKQKARIQRPTNKTNRAPCMPLKDYATSKLQQVAGNVANNAGRAKMRASLPAPQLTRTRAKQAPRVAAMSRISCQRAEEGYEHGVEMYDQDVYDPYIHHRYTLNSYQVKD